MQIRLMLSDSLSIWFLFCLPICLSLIPHPLPTFPTIAYRILIINFVYFISLSYAQVSMSQSLFIKGKDGQQNIWERVLWSGGTKKGSILQKICGFQLICTIFAGVSENHGLERLRRRFQYLMRILISRNEKSIKSDLWILMRNIFWGTLYFETCLSKQLQESISVSRPAF